MQLETENVEVFDPKQFEKEYNKTGLGNESMWQFFSNSYEELVSTVLRPQADNGKYGRSMYDMELLGPVTFNLCGTKFKREDLSIKNRKGLKLVCSYWSKIEAEETNAGKSIKKTCVVYLHSTIGSRVESLQALIPSLRAGCSFFSFDFSGSGMSEGDFVSWGWFENNDVVDVIKYVMGHLGCKKVVLWGRNLGAATAILYCSKDPRIKGLILDTPYSSFEETLQEGIRYAGKKGVTIPNIVLKAAKSMVVRALRNRISPKFKLENLQPRASAKKCKCPSLFVAALRDNYITHKQVENVFKVYRGSKSYTFIDIRHFEVRSYINCPDFLATAETFLVNLFKKNKRLPVENDVNNDFNCVKMQKTTFSWIISAQNQTHKVDNHSQQIQKSTHMKEAAKSDENHETNDAIIDEQCKVALEAITLNDDAGADAERVSTSKQNLDGTGIESGDDESKC